MMGGVSAVCVVSNTTSSAFLTFLCLLQAVAKTSAAPIERIKLLIQNQDEMVRRLHGLQHVPS